ncbi:hypothetical protein RB595_008369 [Gaeumannomyces hyphopodioides]
MAEAEKMLPVTASSPVPGTPPALSTTPAAPSPELEHAGPPRAQEDGKTPPSPLSSAVGTPSRTPSPEPPQTTGGGDGPAVAAREPSLAQAPGPVAAGDLGFAGPAAAVAAAAPRHLAHASHEGAHPTLAGRLAAGDDGHWAWKVGIRASVCAAAAVGVGCAAWITANAIPMEAEGWSGAYTYDRGPALAGLVAFTASLIWGTTEMLVRFCRRSLHPVHPGANVGVDFVFVIYLIVLLCYSIPAAKTVAGFGSDPNHMSDPVTSWLYYGSYSLNQATDVWEYRIHRLFPDNRYMEWNATSGEWYAPTAIPGYKVQRNCASGRWGGVGFADCAAQDAFVNGIWRQKPTRLAADVALCVAEALLLAGHLALFVWACADCARRNRIKPARALARQLIYDMVDRGELLIPDRSGSRGHPARPPQPAEFTPVPAHLRRCGGGGGGHHDPSHWESQYGAYDPVDRPRGDEAQRRRPQVPFQEAPFVLPYGRRTPGWRSRRGPPAPPAMQEKEKGQFV